MVLHTLFTYEFNDLSTVYSMTTPAAWNKCHQIKGLENNKLESMKQLWLSLRHHPAIYLVRQGVRKEEKRAGGEVVFYLTLWKTLADAQCNSEKTECHLQSSATNRQNHGQPLKFWAFCRVCSAFTSCSKGLQMLPTDKIILQQAYLEAASKST